MATQAKSALVTGGAGFIGSHLCDRLLKDGFSVICLDNFYTGSRENIAHVENNSNFELVEHDVTTPFSFDVGYMYHLASPASPIAYQRDPVFTTKTNIVGTLHALELAKKTGARFLQASTSEVYGNPLEHPQKETYWGNVNPIGPRACYDEGKRAAETLCFDYARQYAIPIRVVRIFNTYGPRMAMNDGRVVSNFIVQALRNEDITIYGDGSQTRSFQYIDDVIEGMARMMENKEAFQGPVNLGNPDEYTIKDFAEKIIECTGSKSRIVFAPLPIDDPERRQPDISLAKEKLGWEPCVPLEEGLRKTIEYFREKILP